ncbi:MAG: T9SS type A sorting domain-containing protein [Bacteroidota bacterium]
MKKALPALVVLVLGLLIQRSYASHAMGADITYECIGTNQYRVTLSFYRDCEGIYPQTVYALQAYSTSCARSLTFNVTRQSIREVSPLCPALLSQSECNPGGTLPGVEEFIYQGVVTLPQACTDWTIGYEEGYRNATITTINNPSSTYLYVETTLNNVVAPCNNSPTFTNIPTPFICRGQSYLYNHGAVDAEGDSLVYALVDPLNQPSSPVSYRPGYSGTTPITSVPAVSINSTNGDVSLTPTATEIGIMAVRVSEYRNGVLIGSVTRDIQVTVLNCTNANPIAGNPTGVTGGLPLVGQTLEVCAGNTISFNVPGTDANATDSIWMRWNNGIAGATFTPDSGRSPIQGRFTWTPGLADIGSHTFVVNMEDNACPIKGIQARAITLVVRDRTAAGPDLTYCTGSGSVPATLSAVGGNTFTWRVLSGDNASLSCNTCASPSATPLVTTTYEVLSNFPCTPRDTVTVTVAPGFALNMSSDTVICDGSTAIVKGTPSSPGAYAYTWQPPLGLAATNVPTTNASPGNSTMYYLTALAPNGCQVRDSVKVDIVDSNLKVSPYSSAQQLCAGDPVKLYANVSGGPCSTYVATSIPYSPVTGTGTGVTLTDESVSGILPIGFDFDFYCNTYSGFYIGSNGWMQFSNGVAPTDPDWSNDPVPTATGSNNLIAFAWDDLNPGNGGTISYFTTGTAPNRQLVMNMVNVPHAGCLTCLVNVQVVLHEGSGEIDVHSTRIDNGGPGSSMTQGIENATGTFGAAVPGKNGGLWSTLNESWKFHLQAAPGSYAVQWRVQGIPTVIGTGDSIQVNPPANTTYDATIMPMAGNCPQTASLQLDVASVDAGPHRTVFYGDTAQVDGTYFGPPATFTCYDYTVQQIPHAPVAGNGTAVNLGNNDITGALNIGFPFTFYCNTYTQFYIASDGWITFTNQNDDNSADPIPDNRLPDNLVALFWENLNNKNFSRIDYRTIGTFPNRQLVVNFREVHHYGTNGRRLTGQIILHETTHYIDVLSTDIDDDGGGTEMTQGIENNDGTRGLAVPGRNHSRWSVNPATPDAYRFYPPPGGLVYRWSPGATLNDSTIEDPKAGPLVDTWYTLTVYNGECILVDSMLVTIRPLAVELLDFDAQAADEGQVQLSWQTASENQLRRFSIERSEPGQEFSSIGDLIAVGNSDVLRSYEYLDLEVPASILAYRLRMENEDGTFVYSDVVEIDLRDELSTGGVKLYPNPNTGHFFLRFTTAEVQPGIFQLIGLNGKEVYREIIHPAQAGKVIQEIEFPPQAPGIYLFQLQVGRDRFTGKVLIEP